MKIGFKSIKDNINFSQEKNSCYYIILIKMFNLKELKLMFLDPTDLVINNINRLLSSNKVIKSIFS